MDSITDERYYEYMIRRSREEDAIMAQENVINKAARSIWVTFRKEGVHMYPGADSDPKLATGDWDDVSFLGVPHRHIFHFRVSIEVFQRLGHTLLQSCGQLYQSICSNAE